MRSRSCNSSATQVIAPTFRSRPRRSGSSSKPAEQLGAQWAVLLGDEWPQIKVKTLATREEVLIPPADLLPRLQTAAAQLR
jgi:hypothetical protein